MRTVLNLRNEPDGALPSSHVGPDIRFPEALAEAFIDEFSEPGDTVLDPFCGYGATLRAAARLRRGAIGIEIDADRAEFARKSAPSAIVHRADARELASLSLPSVQLALTSPPYMSRFDPEDPLTNYVEPGRGYEAYLLELAEVFRRVGTLLVEEGKLAIEVANIEVGGVRTNLAWDLADRMSRHLTFEREVVIAWEPTYGFGQDHSYALVFRKGA